MNQSDEQTIQFFNERARGWMTQCYSDYFAGRDPTLETRITRLLDSLHIPADGHVLDVGCGDGFLVPFILNRLGPEATLTEMDVAKEMIQENKRLHPDRRLRFVVADAAQTPIPENPFHAVILFACFPHFDQPERVLAALGKKSLRQGGHLAVCHMMSSQQMNDFHRKVHPAVSRHRLPDAQSLTELTRQAGLTPREAVEEDGFYLVTAQRLNTH